MKGIAVFVATTGGPVRVERITRERAPQSMVCLRRTSTILPISAAYDSFVRPGSGVIERIFGPLEDGAFRLDVSEPIETGESWQLGFFVAHALCASPASRLLATEENAEAIIWLTGHVDYDLAVGSVGHLAEKVHASRRAISGWLAAGRPVTMFVRDGPDHEAAVAAGVPEGAQIVRVCTAADVLVALDLAVPASASLSRGNNLPVRRLVGTPASARWLTGGFAVIAIAAIAVIQWPSAPIPGSAEHFETLNPRTALVPTQPEQHAAAAEQATVTAVPTPPQQEAGKPAVGAQASSADQPAAAAEQPAPAESNNKPPIAVILPKVAILERRAPAGRTCAEVQFGSVPPVEVPVPGTGAIQGLCGLGVAVDNGDQATFVAVILDVLSGRLLYGTVRPDLFAGQTSFAGRHEWAIDLPRRLAGPFEIRVTAISGQHAVAEEANWFRDQSDAAAAAKELSSKGIATSVLRHRVQP